MCWRTEFKAKNLTRSRYREKSALSERNVRAPGGKVFGICHCNHTVKELQSGEPTLCSKCRCSVSDNKTSHVWIATTTRLLEQQEDTIGAVDNNSF